MPVGLPSMFACLAALAQSVLLILLGASRLLATTIVRVKEEIFIPNFIEGF
jgi:hypothetical protein